MYATFQLVLQCGDNLDVKYLSIQDSAMQRVKINQVTYRIIEKKKLCTMFLNFFLLGVFLMLLLCSYLSIDVS